MWLDSDCANTSKVEEMNRIVLVVNIHELNTFLVNKSECLPESLKDLAEVWICFYMSYPVNYSILFITTYICSLQMYFVNTRNVLKQFCVIFEKAIFKLIPDSFFSKKNVIKVRIL